MTGRPPVRALVDGRVTDVQQSSAATLGAVHIQPLRARARAFM